MNEDRTPSEKQAEESQQPEIRYVNLYEKEDKIYTRKITGFFQNIRRYTGIPLIAAYILLPWLMIDGRPAILFDLPTRQFHVLWMTFWPQDFMLLAWALIISAFTLFTVTVLLGRVWCGFTCPQTVWTLMFMSIESFCEGDRNKRIKLDQQGWTPEKIARKTSKHALWFLVAFITGVTFIGYFMPIRELLLGMVPLPDANGMLRFGAPPAAIFWTLFFTGMTYMNAGWLREQVCKYMCPYARFQSVMYDEDTLAVYYDKKRGDPRGARKGKGDDKPDNLGDCIDCSWCVQVCPVDIDIRDGLQFECINCGLCVDACNAVMDKMQYPRGLIRFTSEDELKTGHTKFVRPRLFGYSFAVLAMVAAFISVIAMRSPLGVDVARDRGARLYRISDGQVQNVYTVKISNMDQHAHYYKLKVEGDYPFAIRNMPRYEVKAGEVLTLPIRVGVDKKLFKEDKVEIRVLVEAESNNEINAVEKTTFMGPGNKSR